MARLDTGELHCWQTRGWVSTNTV